MASQIVPFERIRSKILVVRGHRVMLSTDLAPLYGVETKALMQAVKRNLARFPDDFMFRLDWQEMEHLAGAPRPRSQFVTLKRGTNVKYLPYAFTEHGVAMLSSVLKSKRAVEMNIAIVRAFVQLRQWLIGNKDLAHRVSDLQKKYELKFETLDGQLKVVFEALQELMGPSPVPPRKQIGFTQRRDGTSRPRRDPMKQEKNAGAAL